jgi:hypothetical protein
MVFNHVDDLYRSVYIGQLFEMSDKSSIVELFRMLELRNWSEGIWRLREEDWNASTKLKERVYLAGGVPRRARQYLFCFN